MMRANPAHEDHLARAQAARLGQLARGIDSPASATLDAQSREQMLRALEATHRPRARLPLMAAAAIVLLGVGAGITLVSTRLHEPPPIEYRVSGSSFQMDRDAVGVAEGQGRALLRFSEGTEMALGAGSRGRVSKLSSQGARVDLDRGHLQARVVHRPDARWLVGAGPYAIDVTGTVFDVSWSKDRGELEVELRSGSVVVRGPALHDGVRLVAGQRLTVRTGTGTAELSSLAAPRPSPAPTPAPAAPAPASPPPSAAAAHPAPSWSELLTSGNFKSVLASAQARGLDATLHKATLPDLVALSDAARYAGDRALARRGLLAQRSRFAASAEAHAAAFVLGRMADDEGSLDAALHWYDSYLLQSPHGAFAAEALGNKLVMLERSGDHPAARAMAKLYLSRFARGAHAAYAREVLGRP